MNGLKPMFKDTITAAPSLKRHIVSGDTEPQTPRHSTVLLSYRQPPRSWAENSTIYKGRPWTAGQYEILCNSDPMAAKLKGQETPQPQVCYCLII